jgi:hypothetical protein
MLNEFPLREGDLMLDDETVDVLLLCKWFGLFE